jgi:hypothetical protein
VPWYLRCQGHDWTLKVSALEGKFVLQPKMAGSEQTAKWLTAQDGLEHLTQSSGPMPKPSKGEVLVEIHTVALNYRDTEGETSLVNLSRPDPICQRKKERS